MGPRLFRRGNRSTTTDTSIWDYLLQWGHAYSGVETVKSPEHYAIEVALQWGHAYSGVETGSITGCLMQSASMGPRLFRRSGLRYQTRITLQWGHAYSGVETA